MSKDTLQNGEKIEQRQSLSSKNGAFTLQLQEDENLVLYERATGGDKAVWATNTQDSWIKQGIMQPDGNFVLYDEDRIARWSTNTNGKGDKTSILKVADEGNIFIISGGKEIWRAREKSVREPSKPVVTTPAPQPVVAKPVEQPKPVQPNPTNPVAPTPQPPKPVVPVVPPVEITAAVPITQLTSLRGGQSIALKTIILSPNGKTSLVLQEDGNLCSYYKEGTKTQLLWTSTTDGKGVATAKLRATGELVLLKSDNTKVWSSDSSRASIQNANDAILIVQDNGHFVIFANAARIWRSLISKIPTIDPDRLYSDQYLPPDSRLVSPNGKIELKFQEDRNFCLYNKDFVGAKWTWTCRDRETISKVILTDGDDLWYGERGAGEDRKTSTTRRRAGNGDSWLQVTDEEVAFIKSDGITIWSTNDKKVATEAWAPITTQVASNANKIKAGEHLVVGTSISSKNGHYSLWVSEQGNFTLFRKVGTGEWQFLFSTKTQGNWVSKVCVTWTGQLIVYGANSKNLWQQGNAQSDGNAELNIQDDGNLVLARDGNTLWATETSFPASIKQVDRIRYGEWLAVDQSLTSANGQYTLTMGTNANFTITKKSDNSKIVTIAAKNITGAQLMRLDKDLNDLVIYNKDGKQSQREGKVLWQAGNDRPFNWNGATEFIMQDDGNAVFYMQGVAKWAAKDFLVEKKAPDPAPKPADPPKTSQPTGGGGGGGAPPIVEGGDGTNFLKVNQKLKFGESLITDPTRRNGYNFSIDYRGLLAVSRDSGSPRTIWTGGTDNAVSRTAFFYLSPKGQLIIRGKMDPNDGGDGRETDLWWGGPSALVQDNKDLYFMIEEDGCPAIYKGPQDVLWRMANWNRIRSQAGM